MMEKFNFEQIWDKYIVPLKGQTLCGHSGQLNKIVNVDMSGLERISKNGKLSKIPIHVFKDVVETLIKEGKLSRSAINANYPIRASSAIVLILSQVPLFALEENPLTLIYDGHK